MSFCHVSADLNKSFLVSILKYFFAGHFQAFTEEEDRDGCLSLIISISKCSVSNQWHLNLFGWALNEPSSSCSQQVLPSLQPQIRLCSATARSQRRSGRAPVNWPAHSLRPAGPETGRGSSLQLLDLQTAGREPPGRSTASWLHICGMWGFVIRLFVYMMFTSCRIHMTWMFLWCFTDKKDLWERICIPAGLCINPPPGRSVWRQHNRAVLHTAQSSCGNKAAFFSHRAAQEGFSNDAIVFLLSLFNSKSIRGGFNQNLHLNEALDKYFVRNRSEDSILKSHWSQLLINLSVILWIHRSIVWSLKSQKTVKKVDQCFVHKQRHSVYCHRGKTPENIHI